MKDFRYHLSVHDCRAIKSAEIDLSEITVLTGVNASGKSTIARLFRDLVELSAEYERLLAVQMWNGRLDMWRYALSSGVRALPESARDLRGTNIVQGLAHGVFSLTEAIELLDRAMRDTVRQMGGNDARIQRIRRFMDLPDDRADILSIFQAEVSNIREKFDKRRKRRSYVAYRDLMRGSALEEGRVLLEEAGRMVFSNDEAHGTLDEISFIKRAIYIESPLKSIPLSVTTSELNMGDAFTRMKEDVAPSSEERLSELREILSGGVDFEREFDGGDYPSGMRALLGRDGRWMYHRKDGRSFDLDECATGIKALSILSILHSKGWLDAETLLVIDEPEAHLHPQWIVEYARILLLLSKRLKVRIVMTSHSPDMVNAIHTIGRSLGMENDIGFYLAEEDEQEKFKFNYRSLGNKVGPIFKAYNVSFDRIDAYARNGLPK